MAALTPPYFFDEFLRPLKRDEPTPRERALGLTVKDLEWLHTLYYATDLARQDKALRTHPMVVETFSLGRPGTPPVPLAGVFMMSPTPNDNKAVLYTPYGGIEVFDDRDALISDITNRINKSPQNNVLYRFIPIKTRHIFSAGDAVTLTATTIEGGVLEAQEHAIQAAQQQNLHDMLDQLRKIPTLPAMLDTAIGIMARSFFPELDQRDTRMNSFNVVEGQSPMLAASVPLNEALLQFYLTQHWPAGQTRSFTNPRYSTAAFSVSQARQELEHWHNLIEQTASVLSKLLAGLLQSYWNAEVVSGQSRLGFFVDVMSDAFSVDLLLKRQAGILSADECHQLQALHPPDVSAHAPSLHVEKVRLDAPYQHHVELAGALMASGTHAYLYTQHRGLQVLKDIPDLKATLLSMLDAAGHQDELLNFLSLEERSIFLGLDPVQVSGTPVSGNVFADLVEGIAAKQLSNMDYALSLYRRSDGQVDLEALLDCALDVRSLFDPRLHAMEAGGRWSLSPVSSPDGRPSTLKAERAKRALPQLQSMETALTAARQEHPTLRRLAAHALDMALQKHALALKAKDIHLNTYPTPAQEREERQPEQSSSMLKHFIQRLAGETDALRVTAHTGFYGTRHQGAAHRLPRLNTAIFNTVVEQVLAQFAHHDLRTLPEHFFNAQQRSLSNAMLEGLRCEAQLRHLSKHLRQRGLDILETVLRGDSPVRLTRHGLNGFLPGAFGLTVKAGAAKVLRALANCFVLTERGGVDPQRSGHALLWTPRQGHELFTTLDALLTALTKRLSHPERRMHLLENLSASRRPPHQDYELGPLQRIDDHLLVNRQRTYRDSVVEGIDYRLSMGLGATALQDSLDEWVQQPPPTNLARAAAIARTLIQQQALPAWLGMASAREQLLHAELMEQMRLSAPDNRDYLDGITSMRDYVASTLAALLMARFPDEAIDPDQVVIPRRFVLDDSRQTLTDFALRHLPELMAETLHPRSRTATPLPATLNGQAVLQIVQQLNLKQVYAQWFATHLGLATDDANQRRERFCRLLPWQLLRLAHEDHLEERLSHVAWSLIQHVFNMPDAVARAAVSGVKAIIRPLELIATPGAAVARAAGIYLIGPPHGEAGPQVLYTPYRAQATFKEYPQEEHVLHELNRPGSLQDWVARHLGSAHQAIYQNLWRQRTPGGTSDIRLGSTPIPGNALLELFRDNIVQLSKMLDCQFDPAGAAQWQALTHLLGKGIPKALDFMAGKLTFPKVIWRSYTLFKDSAEQLQQQRWNEGLRTFIRGVAQMAALRGELDTRLDTDEAAPKQPSVSEWLATPPPKATCLATLDITGPLRTNLREFEVQDIALSELSKSLETHVYKDTDNLRAYVPVGGKVYPVKRASKRWRIALGERHGPCVERNAEGQWVLDLNQYNPRYGKTLSRFANRVNTHIAQRESINIEANGMREIEALSSWKAQCINEALNVATYYAVTCKRNLELFGAAREPFSRLGRFFSELFGVHRVTAEQLSRIEQRVDEVLNELVNPTLTRPDSTRFVCGTSRYISAHTYAFTLPDDAQNRIYLVERFFDPMMDVYQNRLTTPFDLSAHARAATLIHELTHVRCDTEDIAYLDSMRPFHDLINANVLGAAVLRTDLRELRTTALSTLTPAQMLFKSWDAYADRWEDPGARRETRPVRDKILKITGAKTLDDARQVFMTDEDKRIDIILANADSVTYMITQLGRELDAGA